VAALAQHQLAALKTVDNPLLRYRMRCKGIARRKGRLVDNFEQSGMIPPMILILDAKRRLTLPASLVAAQPGDNFEAVFDPEEDAVIFRRLSKNANWLTVLKGCPVKMDDLPPRRREFPKRLKL
jgi:hypothetical protein